MPHYTQQTVECSDPSEDLDWGGQWKMAKEYCKIEALNTDSCMHRQILQICTKPSEVWAHWGHQPVSHAKWSFIGEITRCSLSLPDEAKEH